MIVIGPELDLVFIAITIVRSMDHSDPGRHQSPTSSHAINRDRDPDWDCELIRNRKKELTASNTGRGMVRHMMWLIISLNP